MHRIRLGSQWDLELLPEVDRSSDESLTPTQSDQTTPQRLKTVGDWLQAAGADYRGHLRLVRRFGRPSGLTPDDVIELLIASLQTPAVATLNGHILPPPARVNPAQPRDPAQPNDPAQPSEAPNLLCYDVSAILLDRNQLSINLDATEVTDSSKIMRDVWLEITPPRTETPARKMQ